MMTTIDELLFRMSAEHELVEPSVTAAQDIAQFERETGYLLPPDMRQFYLRSDGGAIYDKYIILPIVNVDHVSKVMAGHPGNQSPSWFDFCDVGDGNFLAVDLNCGLPDKYPIIDCHHETYTRVGRREIVALNFTEFLGAALSSGGQLFYLKPEFVGYGNV